MNKGILALDVGYDDLNSRVVGVVFSDLGKVEIPIGVDGRGEFFSHFPYLND